MSRFSEDGKGSIQPKKFTRLPFFKSVFSFQRMGRVAALLLVLPLLASVGGEEEEGGDGGRRRGENLT